MPPDNGTEAEKKRSTSKISQLPAAVRERLNQLLHDGLPYLQVIEQLGQDGTGLNQMDISRWLHSGHNLWVQQQTWLGHVSNSFEAARNMVRDNKAATIHEANLHLAATQMHNAMLGCDLATLPQAVKDDPEKLFKVLHAIPVYAHQALNFQKYSEACAQARAEIQKLRDPNRTLTDEERRIIVNKVDEILGLK